MPSAPSDKPTWAMTPPGRIAAIAARRVGLAPTQSMTTSTVESWTILSSIGSKTWQMPALETIGLRQENVSAPEGMER